MQKHIKKLYLLLGSVQVFIALGAIPAGFLFLADTSGAKMGNSVEMLNNSPFKSFLIPGLFLFLVNGSGNVIGAILSFRRKPISGLAGLTLGLIMVIWILFQVYWIGLSSFMQPLFFVIGLIEALIGWIIYKKSE